MRIEFVPMVRLMHRTEGGPVHHAPNTRSFCSPSVTIINCPGRPTGSVGSGEQTDSAISRSADSETDPVATQIPNEAQELLNEVLNSFRSDVDDPMDT